MKKAITIVKYRADNCYYPIDSYLFQSEEKEAECSLEINCKASFSKYHILYVPLLGQFNGRWGGDWCGRTAASMIYNWRVLVESDNPKNNYIKHWRGNSNNQKHVLELLHANETRAFHRIPDYNLDPTKALSGYDVYSKLLSSENGITFNYTEGTLLKYGKEDRLQKAKEIALSNNAIAGKFQPVLKSLENNNPVIMYTGFSRSYKSDNVTHKTANHLILVIGYIFIQDSLWLVVADPEADTSGRFSHKILNKCNLNEFDFTAPDSGKQNLIDTIIVIEGSWAFARASVRLMRARRWFEPHPKTWQTNVKYSLLMDDCNNADRWGGTYLASSIFYKVPSELIFSNILTKTSFPIQNKPDERSIPLNYYLHNEKNRGGYFLAGLKRNIHAGIHLRAFDAGAAQPIRSIAPGFIVAARLVAKNTGIENESTISFVNGYTGFVLVRHEFKIKKDGKDTTCPVYSLYMHLMPPDWGISADPYRQIGWIERFFKEKAGLFVNLDSDQGVPGETGWIDGPETINGQPSSCKVFTDKSKSETKKWGVTFILGISFVKFMLLFAILYNFPKQNPITLTEHMHG